MHLALANELSKIQCQFQEGLITFYKTHTHVENYSPYMCLHFVMLIDIQVVAKAGYIYV